MEKLSQEAEKIMEERFGKDTTISLATAKGQVPYVRTGNTFYEDRAFYVLTYGLSNKVEQIKENSAVAICGDWFTAHGKGVVLGSFRNFENRKIAERMETVFSEWIHNGHNDLEDSNTVILRLDLTEGVLFSHGTRYDIDFTK